MKLQHAMTWKSAGVMALGAAAAALFAACGQDAGASSVASEDTASAYAALSASVQACADDKEECVTAAAGDAAKLSACDAAAESCMKKTHGAQAEAKRHLRDDAEGCVRRCGRRGDDDAGVDEANRPELHKCVKHRAPAASSECLQGLFACLDKTGLNQSTAETELDGATKNAISACVQTAHTCFMTEMSSRPRGDHGGRDQGPAAGAPTGHRDEAGRRAIGEGGRPASPGAEAGHMSQHAAGARAFPSEAGRPAAGQARGRRDGAGGAGGN